MKKTTYFLIMILLLSCVAAKDFYVKNNSDTFLFVEGSTGNVGVGTGSPGLALHVVDRGNNQLRLERNGASQNGFGDLYANGYFALVIENGSNTAVVGTRQSGGLVIGNGYIVGGYDPGGGALLVENLLGVGVSDPSHSLAVAGSANITSNIYATQICDEAGGNCKDISDGWSTGDGGNSSNEMESVIYDTGNDLDSIGNAWTVIASSGTNDINFDSDTFVVDTGNNRVGIGVASPNSQLQLNHDTSTPTTETDYAFSIKPDDTIELAMGSLTTGGYSFIQSFDPSTAWTGKPLVLMPNNGRVGIGATNPGAILEVMHSDNKLAIFNSTDDAARIQVSDDDTTGYFNVKDSVVSISQSTGLGVGINIDASGSVGIGLENPSDALAVSGSANITQTVYATQICDEAGGNCKDVSTGWAAGGTGNSSTEIESVIYDTGNDLDSIGNAWTVTASSGTNDINFDSDTFVVDTSANRVGIGTTSPSNTLTTSSGSDTFGHVVSSSSLAIGEFIGLGFRGYDNLPTGNPIKSGIAHIRTHSYGMGDLVILVDSVADANNVSFSNEVMRVVGQTGYVGIGATNPSEKLQIGNGSTGGDAFIRINANGGGYSAGIKLVGGSADIWAINYSDTDNTLRVQEDGDNYITISNGGGVDFVGSIDVAGITEGSSNTLSNDISGSAADVSCTNCLTATEVQSSDIAYDLSCSDCIGGTEIDESGLVIPIIDTRAEGDVAPENFSAFSTSFSFTDDITGSPNSWDSVLTMKGWSDTYRAWQLISNSNIAGTDYNLYFRSGIGSSWGNLRQVWDEESDGSGSGLDADTLDTIDSGSFARSDQDDTLSGAYIFSRNGAGDNIRVGDDAYIGDVNSANTIGISGVQAAAQGYINFGSSGSNFGYDGSNLVYGTNEIWHEGNDGATSGMYAQYAATAYDLSCTDCLSTGEIADVYLLDDDNDVMYAPDAASADPLLELNYNGAGSDEISLRFHDPSNFWYKLTAKSDGMHIYTGGAASTTHDDLYVDNLFADGELNIDGTGTHDIEGTLYVDDLICESGNCLGAADIADGLGAGEISDIYVFTAGDTMGGQLSMGGNTLQMAGGVISDTSDEVDISDDLRITGDLRVDGNDINIYDNTNYWRTTVTEGTYDYVDTRIGIGDWNIYGPTAFKVHINSVETFRVLQSYAYVYGNFYVSGSCTGGSSCDQDLAEGFIGNKTVEAGDIVSVDNSTYKRVSKSQRPYDKNVIGIISTNPTLNMGQDNITDSPVALQGVVPVKVSSINGIPNIADEITSSQIPGMGMKATIKGPTVGKIIENSDWSNERCRLVDYESIVWPQDSGNNEEKPCYRVKVSSMNKTVRDELIENYGVSEENEIFIGKLKVLVNLGYYEPQHEELQGIDYKVRIEKLEQENHELKERIQKIEGLLMSN